MGGRSREQQTSTTTVQLPPNQQQNVDLLMQAGRDIFNSGGPQFYPGQTYANPSSTQIAGRTGATGYAQGAGQNFVNQLQGSESFFLNPANIFNPSNIPGFRAATEGVTQSVTDNLMRNIIPAIRGNNVASGSLGGSRGAIAEGLAVGETNANLGRILADMNMNAYNSGLNMYNSAAARAPQTFGLGLAPSNILQDIGAQQRADTQMGIDEAVARFNFNEMRPIIAAQLLQQLTGTAGQYGGTTTQETTRQLAGGGNGWLQGLGSLMMIASALSRNPEA